MHAIDILQMVLSYTVDVPYTVESVSEISHSTVMLNGYYHLEEGLIEDQLTIGLRTYFRIQQVISTVEPVEDGWYGYSVRLTRKSAFVQVGGQS